MIGSSTLQIFAFNQGLKPLATWPQLIGDPVRNQTSDLQDQ